MSNKNVFDLYKLTEYYVESVLDYTSRYNSPSSIGYSPENLCGKALRYPNYGDFPDTYTLVSERAEILCRCCQLYACCFGRNRTGNGAAKAALHSPIIGPRIATHSVHKITSLLGKVGTKKSRFAPTIETFVDSRSALFQNTCLFMRSIIRGLL